MKNGKSNCWLAAAAIVALYSVFNVTCPVRAADAPPAPAAPAAGTTGLVVKPAGPGVFTLHKLNATRFQLTLAGHSYSSRQAIEQYLAFRAAKLTQDQGYQWFSFVQHRSKADTVMAPKRDPDGPSYSFRLELFQPVWRYKTNASPTGKNWSPFSGAAFWANGVDPKTITQFTLTADIQLHKGQVQGDDPLAFDAGALSDYLINQVGPPQ
jgi:hypothetical protein